MSDEGSADRTVSASAAATPGHAAVRLWAATRGPLGALGLIAALSTGLRLLGFGQPPSPFFDEPYYVGAGRNIAGLHGPATQVALHLGLDPNAEHPALGKLLIAGSIRLFGDTPGAWRLPSLIFGTAAILLMYSLVRAAGGGQWMAVAGAALMGVDNLLFVHGRIATLDIFVVVFMLAAAVLYLRGRWMWAGVAIGVGMCTKLVAVDLLFVFALLEGGRILARRRFPDRASPIDSRQVALRFAGCAGVAAAVYLVVLSGLDLLVTTYRNPVAHTLYMLRTVSIYTGSGPGGVPPSPLSAPWEWLYNEVPIPYFRQQMGSAELINFRGLVSPPIAYAIVPAMALAAGALWKGADDTALVALAWFLGTMVPFTISAISGRATYLYYMVIVLPAVYLAIARVALRRPRPPAPLQALYGFALLASFIDTFPLRSWSVMWPW